jgi:hypothetical protein
MKCLQAFGRILLSAKNHGPLSSPFDSFSEPKDRQGKIKEGGAEGGLHG